MNPTAVLNIMVQVQGASAAAGQINQVNTAANHSSSNLNKLKKAAKLAAGAAGIGALAGGLKTSVEAFNESRKVAAQTEAVLKSTGRAAGVTAKQVSDLADAISRKTGVDDEAIQKGENLLLTFTNLRNEAGKGNDIFNQTTKIMVDMSAALGQDAKASAIQLGKALNDPVKGVTALQRVGVSFTADQKKQIKSLVASGKALDAQKLILKELSKEFGGSAAAQATAGAKLKVTLGNLQELVGSKVVPILEKGATALNNFLIGMQDGTGAGGKFRDAIVTAFDGIKTAAQALGDYLTPAFDKVKTAVQDVSSFVQRIRDDFDKGTPATQAIATAVERLGQAYQTLWTVAGPVFSFLVTAVKTYYVTLAGLFAQAATFIFNHRDQIAAAAATIRDALITAFNAAKGAVVSAIQFIGAWIDKHRDDIDALVQAWKNIAMVVIGTVVGMGIAIKAVIENVIAPAMKFALTVVKAVWPAIRQIIEGVLRVIGGLINVFSGIFTGDFNRMWQGVKEIFTGAVKVVVGSVKSLGTQLLMLMEAVGKLAVKGLVAGLKGIGDLLVGLFTSAFTSAANLVVGFVNKIIDVINKIPGVDIKHVAKIEGGSGGNAPSKTGAGDVGLARGGAFARTGGMVNNPMVFMGEEAPRHPEFVIPTNPAYRKRAQGLLAQAAGALGYAKGGINVADYNHVYPQHFAGATGAARLSPSIVKAIAESQGLPGTAFEQIAHGESNYYPGIVQRDPGDGMVGYGLWQNTPNAWGTGSAAQGFLRMLGGIPALLNPVINAKMAKFLYQAAGNQLTPWRGTRYLGKSGGGFSDTVGKVIDALNPLDFIKDLPSTKGLGWLSGMGKNLLGKTGSWIKDKVSGIFGGGSGGDLKGADAAFGPVMAGLRKMFGSALYVMSGFRAGSIVAGTDRLSNHAFHAAIDISYPGLEGAGPGIPPESLNPVGAAALDKVYAFLQKVPSPPRRDLLWRTTTGGNHFNHVHFGMDPGASISVAGHAAGTSGAARGLAWVGERGPELVNFHGGERVFSNRDSMRMAAQGMAVVAGYAKGAPTKGKGGPVGKAPTPSNAQRAAYVAAAIAFDKAKNTPPPKGLVGGAAGTVSDPIPVAVVADPAGETVADTNQAAIDALNELVRLAQERADLEHTLRMQAQAATNVSQSQYAVLAKAIADITNGNIGGRVGLSMSGFRSAAGSVSRA